MHLTDLIRPEGIGLRLAAGDLRGALAALARAARRLLAGADATVRTRPPSP